jgi:hypothetical protein
LRGTPLLPPRAGTTARTACPEYATRFYPGLRAAMEKLTGKLVCARTRFLR